MSAISALGYVVFNVSNLDPWETFATDVLGLQVAGRTDDFISLRTCERAQTILLERGHEDDLTALGWEFDTHEALQAYVDALRQKGVNVIECDRAVTASRKAERALYCIDPEGLRHEFFTGPQIAPLRSPFQSKVLVSGFETGRLGVGHVFHVVKDYPRAVQFARDVLGMKISDYIRDAESTPGVTVDGTFFHVATGRHHSYATATMPFPKRIHHFMLQVKSLDDVGLAYDRARKAGVPIAREIGHHPNDRMTSFYCFSPCGVAIEYGWGGLVIDDDDWCISNYSQLSDWGHRRVASLPAPAKA